MDNEIIWAAGFFDGEGSIVAAGSSDNPIVQIKVCQLDVRPITRFQKAVGCGNITLDEHIHRWSVSGRKALEVFHALYPYLSEPKKEQFSRIANKVYGT